MSEFLAEARVLISPDTKAFRAELTKQLLAATRGVVVPIEVAPTAAKGVAGATAATQALSNATSQATQESLALSGAQQTLKESTTKSTAALLGASSATAKLDAGLLGLRSAIGSSAVIGLGAIALAAIAAGQAIRGMIIQTAAFQREISTFRAITGATADEMERVSEAAKRLGADVRLPAVSASDAAVAMTELAKAGLSVEEAIAGAEGVLELATAAQLSNADAAKIAANALNSFGLAGDQATRVADDFANAANAAQGSIADIGLALQQSSAVARQVGLSLEDTTAILSLFAKNGLAGSDAGTSLRVALIRLVAPTSAAAKEIKELGLQIRDAQGNVRPDVFAQFGEATKNLTPAARDAAAALIFGQDAIRAVSIGAREGVEGLRLMQFQIDQQGTAAEVASARTEGLAGQFSALQSNVQTLGVELGGLVAGPLTVLLKSINDAISSTTTLVGNLGKLAKVKIPPIDIDLGIHLSFGGKSGKAADIAGEVKDAVSSAVGQAITQVVLTPATTSVLRGKLITETVLGLAKGADTAAQRLSSLNQELRAFQQARVKAEQGGDTALADRLTKRINALKDEINGLKSAGEGVHDGVTKPLGDALETLQKLKETASSEDVPFINSLIKQLQTSIPIFQQTEGNINRLRDDFLDLGNSARTGAGGVDALTASLRNLKQQATTLSDQLQKAQAEGASPQAQIAILQESNKTQKAIIANAEKGGRTAGDITTIRKARAQIIANNAAIASLQSQIENDAKTAASEAKKKADDIAQAQEDATKAFISAFDPKKQKLLNQITNAGLTERLSDDIKFEKQLQAFLIAERKAIKDRIRRLKLHGDALKAAQAAIKAINQEIFQVTNEIAQDQAAQQKRTQDILNQKIDLRIRIAQARGDVAAEIKARKARLDRITAELVKLKNAGKKNTVAWLELKAQQVEEIAAIKELEGEAKKKDNAASSFFNFLQTTQGFAQNLLGNLIPGFATKGLVGGSAGGGATGTQDPFAFNPNAAEINTGVRATAQVSSAMGATVKPIQVDTTNSILRQILATLQGRHTRPPEIVHNRRTGSAAFDTL